MSNQMMKYLIIIGFILMFALAHTVEANPFHNFEHRVKSNAAAKWPGDYNMQNYEVNKQMKAAMTLIEFMETVNALKLMPEGSSEYKAAKIVEGILIRAFNKWGDDFSMVQYEFEKQLDAFNSLNR